MTLLPDVSDIFTPAAQMTHGTSGLLSHNHGVDFFMYTPVNDLNMHVEKNAGLIPFFRFAKQTNSTTFLVDRADWKGKEGEEEGGGGGREGGGDIW